MPILFTHPFGSPLALERYPVRVRETLFAWDAADTLILNDLASRIGKDALRNRRILILSDAFGALTAALSGYSITTYSDSFVSHRAIKNNFARSLLAESEPRLLKSLTNLEGRYDLVLIRPPKNLAFLEDILARVSQHLGPNAELITGVMVKHQNSGTFELLSKYIGETTTRLAEKKARLIYAKFTRTPCATRFPTQVSFPGYEKPFQHPSNLFSREKLDIGTRFLLENLPVKSFSSILDLGCANGILGISAKRMNPNAKLFFTDDSWMAIESAKINYSTYFSDEAEYFWTNTYEEGPSQAHDLILCNPPFHQGTTLVDQIAEGMFRNAHRALRQGGTLRVIGNTLLDYPKLLRRIFGNASQIARNPKFTVVDSIR